MIQIQQEIAPLLKDPNWEVFSVDEVRMEQEAITRRAWLKKASGPSSKLTGTNKPKAILDS